ncbi:MAG: hypothetical protein OEW75_11295, partial [Cyclobacteriaceae bacterium]|nr:hypothetical protein [Cyclobacteriaceae bacterium]
MKTLVFLGFVNFFFIAFPCYSQLEEISKESTFSERIYFGGGIDVAFDAFTAKIGLSPFVGYMITSTTSGGIGSTYQFITSRYTSITTNVYGYRFFLMQRLVSNFFAYSEYENL